MLLLFFAGLWLAVLLCYLASPKQLFMSQALPNGPAYALALGVALLAGATGLRQLGVLTAILCGLVWCMVWAGVLPPLALSLKRYKGQTA